uniref:hypothetical protein n=1 Tax=Aeromonas sp. EERV15 TaxID=1833892 RepID=UPI0011476E32
MEATGLFRFSDGGFLGGEWYCAGAGTTIEQASQGVRGMNYTLTSLSRLGACPGSPVEGPLSLCVSREGSCPDGHSDFSGQIDGATIDWSDDLFTADYVRYSDETRWMPNFRSDDARLMQVYVSRGKLTGGYLITPPEAPDGGALYCI